MENGRLGKYEIRGTLGKGAMGTVYDGYDAIIDRRVAIKTMSLPDPSDGEAQEELARFKREAQAAGRLTHPNIVAVYDYGEDGKIAFIVMEYAPGTELKKILDKGDRLPPAEAVRIMEGVLAGLQYSHERGVVHRDIKPGNIILSTDGTVKIADFGIARIESSNMTQAGTVMGTPAYMSPEQFMGQTVDARTDIYSAGVMLYQLLTGERPFEGSMSAIMHKALNTEPPRPSDLSVTAPPALDAVVARAMGKRPEARFDNAAAFSTAIKAAMAGGGGGYVDPLAGDDATMVQRSPTTPPSRPAPTKPPEPLPPAPAPAAKSKAPLLAGVAVIVLAAAGAGGYFVMGGGKTDTVVTASRQDTPVPVSPSTAPASTAPSSTAPSSTAPASPQPTPTTVVGLPPAAPPATPPAAPTPSPVSPPSVTQAPPPAPVQAISPPPTPVTQTPTPTPPPPNPVATVTPPPPAPTPAPLPPATPPPAPIQTASIAATPAMIRSAVTASLRRATCSFTRSTDENGRVIVSGIIGRAAEAAARDSTRAALPTGAAPDSVDFRLTPFDGPYCGVIDLVRAATSQTIPLSLRNNVTVLRKNDDIVPQVTMPDYPAWLIVDYFQSDGGVTHLHPTTLGPGKQEAAGSRVVLGNTAKERWQVDTPYGTDMVVAIASSQPLFDGPRPDDDTSQAYLDALNAALTNAGRSNIRVSASVMLVQTKEK